MSFALSDRSRSNLTGVHPDLIRVVGRAITLTTQDFTVFEGLRTVERQRQYVARGVSKTMNSKHLKQPDGYGHAVDLLPWIDGGPRWEWPTIYPIAHAMREAARIEKVDICWGGAWDCLIHETDQSMKDEVADYCKRHAGPDFIDGPHYQLA
jgi:peptidoglycan L-alanyl-D-glutamate endopeptidase CwlK